jgi:antitoxin (DNA-binding transcriptional repressor) of toxin-antitoxin stability system
MSTITVQEIQRDPTDFLHRLAAGEAILVLDGQRPLAEVKPLGLRPPTPRPSGLEVISQAQR